MGGGGGYGPLKSILHCDAKPFASGPGVGLHPQRHTFTLGIPTCSYLKTRKTPDAKPKICVLPDAIPKRKPVEYRLRWVPMQNSDVGHVHFFFCV